ncbi:MAG: hypothetical protein UY63_C0003G0020 [Parcubacteria group bacterium GW2011_GWA2_51_10]|nr:MAG: hypothetical protein UY63_C0003G0020 [Parcubacteria group bacterium GW2011_GWA2_51_10]
MKYTIEQLIQKAKTIALSGGERAAMRHNLERIMEVGEAKETLVVSPISAASVHARARVPVFVWRRFAPLTLGLVLTLGIGTSFAAEGALPGEPLYPVKIHVNERIEYALATSPHAEAKVEATHAIKRLDEAEKLAHAGKLDAKINNEIRESFSNKVEAVDERIQNLKERGDLAASVEVRKGFEKSLAARSRILAELIDDGETPVATAAAALEVRAMRVEIVQHAEPNASSTLEERASLRAESEDEDDDADEEVQKVRSLLEKIRHERGGKEKGSEELGKLPQLPENIEVQLPIRK